MNIIELQASLEATLTELANSVKLNSSDYRKALRDLLAAVVREPDASPPNHMTTIVNAAREVVDRGESALFHYRLFTVAKNALAGCEARLTP